jgi:hypothetical protein
LQPLTARTSKAVHSQSTKRVPALSIVVAVAAAAAAAAADSEATKVAATARGKLAGFSNTFAF